MMPAQSVAGSSRFLRYFQQTQNELLGSPDGNRYFAGRHKTLVGVAVQLPRILHQYTDRFVAGFIGKLTEETALFTVLDRVAPPRHGGGIDRVFSRVPSLI